MDDQEVMMNRRVKGNQPDVDGTYPKFKSTEDMRKEIEKMSKKLEEENKGLSSEEDGRSSGMESVAMLDSDDEDGKRVENMRNPEKRKFNVNDILGDFDRDERGHPLIL